MELFQLSNGNGTNQLRRNKSLATNKVTGDIKPKTDIKLITDNTNCITDDFYMYEPCKFQFTDFYQKVIQDYNWIAKPKFLLEAKGGVLFNNSPEGLEEAFNTMASLYYNLNDPLQRLYDGYHDSMFIRFALKVGMFTTEHHWNMVIKNYRQAFDKAIKNFYGSYQPKYDPTGVTTYTAFFDIQFSQLLSLRLKEREYLQRQAVEDDIQLVHLDQLSNIDQYSYFDDYQLV